MRTFIILLSFLLLSFNRPCNPDYPLIFGSDYAWAKHWVKGHAAAFEQLAVPLNIPTAELESIVFPELVRYNAVYDVIEIQSLKFLYVSRGKDYADFSVGYFQMKPSFAERVEKDALKYLGVAELTLLGFDRLSPTEDNEANRRDRVERLTGVDGQMRYLAAFYRICQLRFTASLAGQPDEYRLRFLATCYNAGYHLSGDQIRDRLNRKFFHTGKVITSNNYCYADISAYWLKHRME
ncbi:MAG: hypothetical protein IPP31_12135 [Chitinophagaceae bacterium]|nr:hypothetical protein [Chitinophagaceae bacterium]